MGEEILFGKTRETPEFRIQRGLPALYARLAPSSAERLYFFEKAGRPLTFADRLSFLHPRLWASDIFPEILFRACLLARGQVSSAKLSLELTCHGLNSSRLHLVYGKGELPCPTEARLYAPSGRLQRLLYYKWMPSQQAPNEKSQAPLFLKSVRLYFGALPLELSLRWD